MKGRLLSFLAAGSMLMLLSASPALAMVTGEIHVNIPFKFTVENTTFPSGNYLITTADPNNLNLLEIRQENGEAATLVLTEPLSKGANVASQTELVFDKIGGRDFLAEIWVQGSGTGDGLPQSRSELTMKRMGNRAHMKAQRHSIVGRHTSKKTS